MSDLPPPPPPPPPSYGAPTPSSGPDIGAALSYGWNKFTQNAGVLLAIVLVPAGIQLILSLIANVGLRDSFFLFIVVQVLSWIVGLVAAYGIANAALQVTRGEPLDFGKAYQNDRWGEWVLFSIVFGLIITLGFILCIIGALFAVAFFGLAPYFFIDGRMGVGDALNASRQAASNGYALAILVVVLVGIAGAIACGIGIFVTEPLAYVAGAFLYRHAIGQGVAA